MNAATSHPRASAVFVRRAPIYGAALAFLGIAWLIATAWPTTRNPQPAGLAIALTYTALVLTLLLSVRSASLVESCYRMPLCGYVTLVLFAALVAHKVGHWPSYSAPDPKDLHWPFVTAPVFLVVIIALLSVPAGAFALLLVMVYRLCQRGLRGHRKVLLRQGAWWSVGAGVWAYDITRGGLLSWIMD